MQTNPVTPTSSSITLTCADEAATSQLGEDLALALRKGDLVTLSGELGAGKTFLARALIRASADDAMMEVPSPTFTLVQAYSNLPFGSLTHMDLYRLNAPGEIDELGLDEALSDGIVLVEWPEKGGLNSEDSSLSINIEHIENDARTVTIDGKDIALERVRRTLAIRKFLDEHGYEKCRRVHLTGDASTRVYETISPADDRVDVILMNAPEQPDGPPIRDGKPYSQIAHLAEDMSAYVGVATMLSSAGFCAPDIYVSDLEQGLFLIENLGEDSIVNTSREPVPERYKTSLAVLAAIHGREWNDTINLPDGGQYTLPAYDYDAMAIEVDLLPEWYSDRSIGRDLDESEKEDFHTIWRALIGQLETAEKTLVLRDFHSPNIIWRELENGLNRVGIIDFQDALIGPSSYDVGAIIQDARVDISEALEGDLVDHYCVLRNAQGSFDEDNFRAALAITKAQRASKILGIFVRLSKRDGKHDYMAHLPRIESYFERACRHPVLADLRYWVKTVL